MKSSTLLIFIFYIAIATGYRNKTRKIANHGETAKEREFPYQVSLKYEGQHFCGGSLISIYHVLTAAHCTNEIVDNHQTLLKDITAEVGRLRQGSGISHRIKRMSYHPKFENVMYQHDIGVVHLLEPILPSNRISKINLPRADFGALPCSKVFVSGFGAEYDDGPYSPILKMMDAEVISLGKCQRFHMTRLIIGNVCAVRGKDYGTCKGDSGEPLVDKTKTTIIGVVSGGKDCKSGTPGIYTEVSRYIPYIVSELKYNPTSPGDAANNPSANLPNSPTNSSAWNA